MIIFEGPDGAGKSTLIRNLGITRSLWMGGARVKHPTLGVTWACPDREAEYSFWNQIALHRAYPVAFDRFHISERVYGPLLRGEQAMDDNAFHRLRDHLIDLQIPVILCLPPFERTMENVTSAGRERPVYQTDDFLKRSYEHFSALQPWATIVYDFTRDEIPGVSL